MPGAIVDDYEDAREDTHAVDREYLWALETLAAHAFEEDVPASERTRARRIIANRTGRDAPVVREGE